jgi:hypothetical protein
MPVAVMIDSDSDNLELETTKAHSIFAQFSRFFGRLTGINYLYKN